MVHMHLQKLEIEQKALTLIATIELYQLASYFKASIHFWGFSAAGLVLVPSYQLIDADIG
jgi:hypothetical protein